MEELQVSQEFLHQQNEELAAAYEALAAEQRRYQELFEFAPDGYLITDTEGKIQEANRAASTLLNVPQKYLVGKPLAIYVPEKERQDFRSQLAQMPQVERLQEWTVCLQPRHKHPFHAALTVTTVFDSRGNVVSLRWLVRDISDRKQLEEAELRAALAEMTNQALENEIAQRKLLEGELRRQAEALTEANNLKDEFLAIVSHELRSPLNAILGFSQMLRTRRFDEAMSCRALETIERNARAQAQLVEDLLDISRIVRGKLTLSVQPVNLVDVVEAVIDSVKLAATAKGIDIQSELDESAMVSGDGDRLQQVLWHLLTNAIKFTPRAGRIDVRLKREASSAVMEVSDTGQGIHPDFLPYVFERFRQEEQAKTRHHGGLGIGLSIVRQLVELHGGTVQVYSPGEGQGTTFTIRLPLMRATSEHEEPQWPIPEDFSDEDAQTSLKNVSVLVVDDETDDRELLKIVLECAGAHVKAVGSVDEALQAIHQSQPDVLVSDVRMPDQDGYSLIRQLRSIPIEQIRQIPAIALTAYSPDENSRKAMTEGYQLYLPKPIEPDALVAAIASQLNAGAFMHPLETEE
nr:MULTISPECIES: ATP-binding protein [unclassified Leptolyngbya]